MYAPCARHGRSSPWTWSGNAPICSMDLVVSLSLRMLDDSQYIYVYMVPPSASVCYFCQNSRTVGPGRGELYIYTKDVRFVSGIILSVKVYPRRGDPHCSTSKGHEAARSVNEPGTSHSHRRNLPRHPLCLAWDSAPS